MVLQGDRQMATTTTPHKNKVIWSAIGSRSCRRNWPAPPAGSSARRSTTTISRSRTAARIRRVKGVKKLGVRLGNWLTAEQGHALWQAPDCERLKGKRDRALLALLLACGVRRHELAELTFGHLQQREGHSWGSTLVKTTWISFEPR